MMRMNMSNAASALLRALVARAEVPRDRILLSEWRSTDWQSLTLVGERHQISLRVSAPSSQEIADRIARGLADAEFDIGGHIVADIALAGEPQTGGDGTTVVDIEALTIAV